MSEFSTPDFTVQKPRGEVEAHHRQSVSDLTDQPGIVKGRENQMNELNKRADSGNVCSVGVEQAWMLNLQ